MGSRVLTDYPRRAHLEFYRDNPSPFYALTFELEASNVRSRAREAGGSTYAALCWAFHRAILKVEAFRVRLAGEDIVLHDGLRLGMTVPGPNRTFTFSTHDWNESGETFLRAAAAEMALSRREIDLSRGAAPDFAYYTAVPGVPFLGITHVPHRNPTSGQPMTAFGRFREDGPRLFVPVGLQVNHMYVDGIDLSDLYEAAQDSFTAAF